MCCKHSKTFLILESSDLMLLSTMLSKLNASICASKCLKIYTKTIYFSNKLLLESLVQTCESLYSPIGDPENNLAYGLDYLKYLFNLHACAYYY